MKNHDKPAPQRIRHLVKVTSTNDSPSLASIDTFGKDYKLGESIALMWLRSNGHGPIDFKQRNPALTLGVLDVLHREGMLVEAEGKKT